MNDDKLLLDHGDDGKRVIIVTGGNQVGRASELRAAIAASHVGQGVRVITAESLGAPDPTRDVVVLTPNEPIPDVGRPVQPHRSGGGVNIHKSRSLGSGRSVSAMATIAALTMIGTMPGGVQNLTGREVSRRNSRRLEEERERHAQLRSEQPRRRAGMSPAFAAPYGCSQQDLDHIAAAEAKRARKAAKRSKL